MAFPTQAAFDAAIAELNAPVRTMLSSLMAAILAGDFGTTALNAGALTVTSLTSSGAIASTGAGSNGTISANAGFQCGGVNGNNETLAAAIANGTRNVTGGLLTN